MRIICMTCKANLGEKLLLDDDRISHSYCLEYAEEARKQIKEE